MPGIAIMRNPGVALVWVTKQFGIWRVPGGLLFRPGDPEETLWFAEGRPATRDEILESIQSGLPNLEQLAAADGPEACLALGKMVGEALKLLPKAEAPATHLGGESS